MRPSLITTGLPFPDWVPYLCFRVYKALTQRRNFRHCSWVEEISWICLDITRYNRFLLPSQHRMPALCLKFSSYLTNGEIRPADDSTERGSSTRWGVSDESLLLTVIFMHGKANSVVLCSWALEKKKKKAKPIPLRNYFFMLDLLKFSPCWHFYIKLFSLLPYILKPFEKSDIKLATQ